MTGEDLDDDYYSEVSEQLFDLSIDPYELNDLVLDQTYQQQLELFRSRRSYWLERTAPINGKQEVCRNVSTKFIVTI